MSALSSAVLLLTIATSSPTYTCYRVKNESIASYGAGNLGCLNTSYKVNAVKSGSGNMIFVPVSISIDPFWGDKSEPKVGVANLEATLKVTFESSKYYMASSGTYIENCVIDAYNTSGSPRNGVKEYTYTSSFVDGLNFGTDSSGLFSISGGYNYTYSLSGTISDPSVSFSKVAISPTSYELNWYFRFKMYASQHDTFNYNVIAFADTLKTSPSNSVTGCTVGISGSYRTDNGLVEFDLGKFLI